MQRRTRGGLDRRHAAARAPPALRRTGRRRRTGRGGARRVGLDPASASRTARSSAAAASWCTCQNPSASTRNSRSARDLDHDLGVRARSAAPTARRGGGGSARSRRPARRGRSGPGFSRPSPSAVAFDLRSVASGWSATVDHVMGARRERPDATGQSTCRPTRVRHECPVRRRDTARPPSARIHRRTCRTPPSARASSARAGGRARCDRSPLRPGAARGRIDRGLAPDVRHAMRRGVEHLERLSPGERTSSPG